MFRQCAFWSWLRLQCALLWLGPARPAGWSAWAGRQPNIDLPSPYLTQTNTGPSKHCTAAILVIFSNQSRTSILQHYFYCFACQRQVFVWLFIGWEWVLVPPSSQRRVQILWFWAMSCGCGGGWGRIYLIYWSTVPRKLSNWEATRPMAMMPCQQKHMAPEER